MKSNFSRFLVLGIFLSGWMILIADTYVPALHVDYAGPDETVHIKSFQYADVVGYGYCPPKFVYPNPPTWYALETNDVDHLNFFSNLVESIVIARDKGLLYTTLRDAIKSDETGADPYETMSVLTMRELFWVDSETNLVKALYDPLLAPRFRRHALFQLKRRFDWPATNTVPEP